MYFQRPENSFGVNTLGDDTGRINGPHTLKAYGPISVRILDSDM
jgi:hypothetical protein